MIAKIGEGGMGAVYLAHHAMLGRRAAVKVLLPELSTRREIVTRFFNEARAATAIHHPSIVEIFDFGYLPDASAYIVMEFLEGESLSARRSRLGRLEPARALTLVRQIAGALAAAHDRGIVHRDLKPDNVFLVSDPEVPGGERIKILDFGIAKLAGNARDGSRTQTGAVLGTPTYISPEQCRGTGQVDARADLYALGCVLYELVCGRPPFVVDGAGELIAHHLYFEPQPPRTYEPTLPEPVERLILWLLRKDPGARPQSARELVDVIDRLGLGAAAGHAVPPQAPLATHSFTSLPAHSTTLSAAAGVAAARVAAPTRRRRWWSAAIALTAVAAGGAVYVAVNASHGDVRPARATASVLPPAAALTSPPPATRSTPPVVSAPPAVNAPAVANAPRVAKAPPAASPPPEAARQPRSTHVHLALDSDPRGAAVLVDGKQIGTTPLDEDVVTGGRGRVYTIRKNGYEPATVTLGTAHDGSERVVLKKRQRPPKSATPQPILGDKSLDPFDN